MYDLFEVVIFGLVLLLIVDGLLRCFGQLRDMAGYGGVVDKVWMC